MIIQTVTRNILLPVDRMDLFQANLERNGEPLLTWEVYIPRRGETLRKIAHKFATSVSELRTANHLTSSQHLRARQAILVPMGKIKNVPNVGGVY